MRQLVYVLLGCLALAQAQAASFDCAKAGTRVEKLICADPELSRLDEQLNQAYQQARQRPDVKPGIVESQRQWLKQARNACQDAACLKQAYQDRMHELSLGSSFGIVLMRVPPACAAVADAANRGELRALRIDIPEGGLLADINGDGKKEHLTANAALGATDHASVLVDGPDGTPTDLNPAPEEDRDSDEYLIRQDGRFYILGQSAGVPLYLARIGRDNVEHTLCEFAALKPAVAISVSRDDALCQLGLQRKLHYVPFDQPMRLTAVAANEVKLVADGWSPAGIIVEVGQKAAAAVDVNNDGTPDRVVDLHIITGAARGCAGDTLAVLDKSGQHLDPAITPLIPGLDCTESKAPVVFGGHGYIEVGGDRDQPGTIIRLNGTRLETVCQYRVQTQVRPVGK